MAAAGPMPTPPRSGDIADLRSASTLARDRPDLGPAPRREHAPGVRGRGPRICATPAPTRSSSSATCSTPGSATTWPRAASSRAAPRCSRLPRSASRSPSCLATATSCSATRCSRGQASRASSIRRVVTAFGQRVVLSHGDALCVDDVAYQRYPRASCAGRRRSASSTPCRWRCAGAIGRRPASATAAGASLARLQPLHRRRRRCGAGTAARRARGDAGRRPHACAGRATCSRPGHRLRAQRLAGSTAAASGARQKSMALERGRPRVVLR